ncbi:MAG: hypothetical protein LBV43_10150 [Prevotella sp.]|jgi:hypothetical protein|nr:hypothetical protein [Prevotella sp.]
MELDNIKKTWQENEIKPSIDEEKIRRMLNNRSKNAFNRLFMVEMVYFILLIPCIFAGVWFYNLHPIPGILYFAGLVVSFVWQWYKISYLKKIDLIEMGILDVSKRITTYKKYLSYEIFIGAAWGLAVFICFTFFAMPVQIPELSSPDLSFILWIGLAAMIILFAILMILIYKFFYMNNIKKIQDAIKEIEEFEIEDGI